MAEVLHGKGTGDQLNVSADKTQVYGLKGNDTLIADNKSDVLLIGGSGNDSIVMMGGKGTLNGGKGSDVFEFNYSAKEKISAVIEDFEPSSDKIVVNFDGDTAPQITKEVSGSDVILKDSTGQFNVTLKGVRENDYFDGEASDEVWEVLKLTNAEREKNNLSALTLSEGLTTAASIRAEEITELDKQGKFNEYKHTRPNGEDYKTVLVDGNLSLEQKYHSYGENLQAGATSSGEVMDKWMHSDDHKANILDKKNLGFSKLGVGYNYYDTSKYRYYWTQEFADSLKTAETVNTDELSNAKITVNAVSKSVTLTEGDDTRKNTINGATISALGGNDSVSNTGSKVSVSGGADNDTINNSGSFVTINAGLGNDKISLGASVQKNLIQYSAGDGSDSISGFNANSTLKISGNEYTPVTVGNDVIVGLGDDSITLQGAAKLSTLNIEGTRSKLYLGTKESDTINVTVDDATIQALGGNDQINLSGKGQTILYSAGDGSDIISGFKVSDTLKISGSEYLPVTVGNDVVISVGNDSITLQGAANLSTLNIEGTRSKLYLGTEKSDTINVPVDGATIQAFGGNDQINLSGKSHTILYSEGDGKDTIFGIDSTSTLKIGDGTGTYSTQTKGNDVVLGVGNGAITLKDAAKSTPNIEGTLKLYLGTDNPETINATVDDTTINARGGNDQINLSGKGHTILYSAGDGKDTVSGFDETSTLKIGDGTGTYSTQTSGNDITIRVGRSSILLKDAASLQTVNIVGTEKIKDNPDTQSGGEDTTPADSKLITLTEGNDSYSNTVEGATIAALGGNDSISNWSSNVSISGGAGKDSIDNIGANVTIDGGDGNDEVYNIGVSVIVSSGAVNVSINGGSGNDSIKNYFSNVTINGGADNDSIYNSGDSVKIDCGAGNDTIENYADFVSIEGGTGDDSIINGRYDLSKGAKVIITSGDGNDSISNDGDSVKMDCGAGNDNIYNQGSNVTIDGGAGNDLIRSWGGYHSDGNGSSILGGDGNDSIDSIGDSVTVEGGSGDDSIKIYSGAENNLIVYKAGDGDDIIEGFGSDDTLKIFGSYSSATVGSDVIIDVYSWISEEVLGTITLSNVATLTTLNIENDTNFIALTEEDDEYFNGSDSATIAALGGNDSIDNHGNHALVEGGGGNDTLYNYVSAGTDDANYSTIRGGNGADFIDNHGNHALIEGGADNDTLCNYTGTSLDDEAEYSTVLGGDGDDSIENSGAFTEIEGGEGADTINNSANDVTINGGIGNDTIFSNGDRVTIAGGTDNDSISNDGDNVSIDGGAGEDLISNYVGNTNIIIDGGNDNDTVNNWSSNVTINAGAGNDSVRNDSDLVSISGDAGNDIIDSWGSNVTIRGGTGNDSITNYSPDGGSNSVSIDGGAGEDLINNYVDNTNVTMDGGGNNDTINNWGANVSIVGGAGNDSIYNYGGNGSINGGTGDDIISLEISAVNNLVQYNAGDGSDTVQGFNEDDTISIAGGAYTRSTVDNDVILEVDDDLITLIDAAGLSIINIIGTENVASKLITLTEFDDTYSTAVDGATVQALGGDDFISNSYANVSINGGNGDDDIENREGSNITIDGGAGEDNIHNIAGNSATINGGTGNDSIYNGGWWDDSYHYGGSNVKIDGGAGNDYIENYLGDSVTIDAGAGDDSILNYRAKSVTIYGGAGDDSIYNRGSSVTIDGGAGNDSIYNYSVSENVTIDGGAGNDYLYNVSDNSSIVGGDGSDKITNSGNRVTIDGGAGKDTINNSGTDDTILGGKGDDLISLSSASKNNFIQYTPGDGNDVVWGLTPNDTVNISADVSLLSSLGNGNDMIIYVKNGNVENTITLKNARNKPPHVTYGESGTSEGGGRKEGGISGRGGNGKGDGSHTDGGPSTNDDGKSASGRGREGTRGGSGEIFARLRNSQTKEETVSEKSADDSYIYNGGNQVIGDYQANKKIIFKTEYTGSFFDESGNFLAGSNTGALAVQNSANKFIDIRDGAGNPFIKAYAATNAGVIDGRGLTGFEMLNGSNGADAIFAGDGGSQLWGGSGDAVDTLVGGNGADIFVGGQTQGGDIFQNASAQDEIRLNDATLNDISFTAEDNGTIAVLFNNGNVIYAQSTEPLSAKFNLADGSSYRYNHAEKTWQTEQYAYNGGNQVITNYAGEKILFNAEYTGALFDEANNFRANSTTGELTITDTANKFIDIRDGAGNPFIKAYAATNAGVIDGRGLTGFEMLNGSDGSDAIFAGDGGSQLWGGSDSATDTLIGGNGTDIFVGGQTQGGDIFLNASSTDMVNLIDATLNDIAATAEDNGTIAVVFNNGNVIYAQSSEPLSAKFNLADGSAYRFNHETKSWQNA